MAIYQKLVENKSCEAFVGSTNNDLTSFTHQLDLLIKINKEYNLYNQ